MYAITHHTNQNTNTVIQNQKLLYRHEGENNYGLSQTTVTFKLDFTLGFC